ncbi:MAG: hypothetical protein K2X38_01025 [Gemmataceae bacterium]|nr:hypothetical protein [Gemmataceae bacterium]
MRTKKDLRHYLRQWKDRFPLAGIVLRKGQWFIGRAQSGEYEEAIQWRRKRNPQPQECYFNSQHFCSDCRVSRHFEGYLFIKGTPIEHAWAVMDDSKVVDHTIEALERKAEIDKSIPIETMTPLYYGVEVRRSFIMQQIVENGAGRPLAERYYAVKTKRPVHRRQAF